jgi:rhamnogalacturonyl hydrolase YesR
MQRLRCAAIAIGAMLVATMSVHPGVAAAQPSNGTRIDAGTSRSAIALGRRAADWQLANMGRPEFSGHSRGWEQAAFWVGMTRFAERSEDPKYRDAVLAMGRSNGWRLGDAEYNADDHAIGQAYLWAERKGAGAEAIQPMRAVFDRVLANKPRVSLAFHVPPEGYGAAECLVRWCWCDALFMAPPAWIELSNRTGDGRYRDYALSEFWATTDFLYDPAERLYYRDSRFFDRRDEKQRKLFWSRGNGWVFAGIANILPLLREGDPDRIRMEALFREMAARLKQLQKPDGYWAPSLLGPENSPPETSGTGFFTYGLAWGIKAGLLDRNEYEPAVRLGWSALARSLGPDGRLRWVQRVSDRPEAVNEGDTQYYGVGAFLLAASAIADLGPKRSR